MLTDHDMPGMDGVRMTSTVRRFDHTRLAIIGISGSQDPTMTARFIKAGADDYLQKPSITKSSSAGLPAMWNS
jgi:CheY-like chemotaxis protein